MFQEDPRDSFSNQSWDFTVVHACCDEQYFPFVAFVAQAFEKIRPPLRTEVQIEQHDIDFPCSDNANSFCAGATISDNLKSRFCPKQPRDTLTEQHVIID